MVHLSLATLAALFVTGCGAGWLVKVRLSEPSEVEELLDREAYEGSLT